MKIPPYQILLSASLAKQKQMFSHQDHTQVTHQLKAKHVLSYLFGPERQPWANATDIDPQYATKSIPPLAVTMSQPPDPMAHRVAEAHRRRVPRSKVPGSRNFPDDDPLQVRSPGEQPEGLLREHGAVEVDDDGLQE